MGSAVPRSPRWPRTHPPRGHDGWGCSPSRGDCGRRPGRRPRPPVPSSVGANRPHMSRRRSRPARGGRRAGRPARGTGSSWGFDRASSLAMPSSAGPARTGAGRLGQGRDDGLSAETDDGLPAGRCPHGPTAAGTASAIRSVRPHPRPAVRVASSSGRLPRRVSASSRACHFLPSPSSSRGLDGQEVARRDLDPESLSDIGRPFVRPLDARGQRLPDGFGFGRGCGAAVRLRASTGSGESCGPSSGSSYRGMKSFLSIGASRSPSGGRAVARHDATINAWGGDRFAAPRGPRPVIGP